MANFPWLSKMEQNQANFATFLLIIWRIALNTVKYCEPALNAQEMRA
jgi:hypothetical protein